MDNFMSFWLLLAPIFMLLFLVKCMDVYVYKKEKFIKKMAAIILGTFICVIFHLLTVRILILLLDSELPFILILLLVMILLFSVVPLLVMYRIEINMIENKANKTMLVKNNFEIDLKITCAFIIFYFILTVWNLIYFTDSEFVIMDNAKRSFSVSDYTQMIVIIGLMFAAVLYKTRVKKNAIETYKNSHK